MMFIEEELPGAPDGVLKVVYRLSYNYARGRLRDGLVGESRGSCAAAADDYPPMPLEWAETMWRGIEDALAFRPPAL
jgi:hypothetical protein